MTGRERVIDRLRGTEKQKGGNKKEAEVGYDEEE